MMLWLYNLAIFLLAPLWVPWMWFRSAKRAEKPNWKERAGDYSITKTDKKRVWIHAVSVGEVLAATPILRAVKAKRPDCEIVLTTTTSSGHQTAREKLSDLYDHLFYFPIDLPRFTLRAVMKVRPAVVAVMETELWMNFLWAADALRVPTLLINGRISDRSFKRSQGLKFFYRALFKFLGRALMQSENDRVRIEALGMPKAEVLGNCKFDQAVEGLKGSREKWRQELGAGPDDFVVVIGSTRGAEDEGIVLEGLKRAFPDLAGIKIVHAPRHLERVPELKANAEQIWPQVGQRSKGESAPYLILDTYGELGEVYSAADVVVIGGGFANLGGQNLIQPLAHGVPVLHGPHMQNFRDSTAMALDAGASMKCEGSQELADDLVDLKNDKAKRQQMGENAKQLVQSQIGASERYADAIIAHLG